MWKILLFLLIVAALGLCGTILAADLKQRGKDLRQFRFGLSVIEGEMNYETASLGLCFQRAAKNTKGAVAVLFGDTAELLRETGSGEASFTAALERRRDDLAFTENDMEHIRRFGKGLGEKDLEHAVKDLRSLESRLEQAEKEAEANEKKWGRLLHGGGWLMGLCTALILI